MREVSLKDLYDFKNCPARFHLTNLGKVTHKAEKDIVRETFLSVLRYFYLELQDGHLLTHEEIRQKLSRSIANMEGYSLLDPKSKIQRDRELKLIRLVETFYAHESKVDQRIVSVDTQFRMPFSDKFAIKDEIPLLRKVEDNITELVIFKTGRNYINTFWLETDMSISLYAMAYQSLFRKPIDRICIYHIPSGSIYYTERNQKHYRRFLKSVRIMQKTVEDGGYYTRESMLCESCPARYACLEEY